jgi:putative transposase
VNPLSDEFDVGPKPGRKSLRLSGYDYSLPGAYFVTICAQGYKSLFGKVVNNEMSPNAFGNIVSYCWQDLLLKYPTLHLDYFTVMPNHFHGIVIVGAGSPRPETRPWKVGGETPPL